MPKTVNDLHLFLEEKKDELNFFQGLDRIRYLIEIGDEYHEKNPFPEDLKTEESEVEGCISGAYIIAELQDKRLFYKGMSDARTVQGYIALLIESLSGLTPEDIVNHSEKAIEKFLNETHIEASLSANRANAFGNVFRMMVALARKAIEEQ